MSAVYPPTTTTNLLINTLCTSKIVYLPAISTIGAGKLYYIKDICGNAGRSSIYLSTTGLDTFENQARTSTLYALMSTNFQSVLLASDGALNWMILQNYNANVITKANYNFGALSYLPLLLNSTDIGTSPQVVTTNGSVSYTTIGGKRCAYFNNSLNNYLSFPYSNPTNFTLCFWYNAIDSAYYTNVSITNSSVNPALQFDTISATQLASYSAIPNQWTGCVINVAAPGNWNFIAYTLNQTTYAVQMYYNGSLANTASGTGTSFSSRNLFFIGRSGDNGRAFNGYIRQFAFFNRILSATEISNYYVQTA
jgi:hypothetical protein